MKKTWIPQAIIIPMLLLALNPDSLYGFYMFLRWVCCAAFVYLAIHASTRKKQGWVWILGVTAAIYNPILPVHGTREMWTVVNVATIGMAVASLFTLKYDEETIRRKPDVADAYYKQGIDKDLAGQYTAAIADYDKAIQLKPDYAEAYHLRGFNKAVHLCQYAAAIADFTQAILFKPDDAEYYKSRGIAKTCLGEHSAAIQDFDTAISLKSNYDIGSAYIDRGFAKGYLGRVEEGKQDLRIALKVAEKIHSYWRKDYGYGICNYLNGIVLDLQEFEEWIALEKRSKGTSMTFEEVQREFGTILTPERTGDVKNPGRLDFEVVEVDYWGRKNSRWDIHQDGKNIGGFQVAKGETKFISFDSDPKQIKDLATHPFYPTFRFYREVEIIFFAFTDLKKTFREAHESSTYKKSVRSVKSNTGERFYYPSFNTLVELLDYIEQKAENRGQELKYPFGLPLS